MITAEIFADVVLPVPLQKLFTYLVPAGTLPEITAGMRVLVPFGKSRQLSGIVYSVHQHRPQFYEAKPVIALLDEKPLVTPAQLQLWQWMADYYQCAMGEVYRAALPSGLKLESETRFYFNPDFEPETVLPDRVISVLDLLAREKSTSITEINKITGLKSSHTIVKQLIEQNAIFADERVPKKFRTKKETFISLPETMRSETSLNSAFDKLEKAPKQLNLLMCFIQQTGNLTSALKGKEISRKELLSQMENSAAAQLNELLKKNILEQHERETGRLNFAETAVKEKKVLSAQQQKALDEICEGFAENRPVLLHGVTSSGKTEIYIHLIEQAIANNRQVLYLLPEIALTTQITTRLRAYFGNRLGVYHSKYSDAERVEVWNDMLSQNNFRVIVGVRSSIFLPFTSLGLIIVDEEHESSFKQYDPAPRYNARDVALVLGAKHSASVLLGTATPSVESYYNAINGKYRLVELLERYEGIRLPEIIVADTRDAKRRKIMSENFTPELVERMKKALQNKEQIILFQNRRGFAPYLECNLCAWVPKCVHCDVSMTYHKNSESLVCHYCGYTIPAHTVCQACGTPSLSTRGFGTEKVEEDIKTLFPDAGVARMDYDTTRSKTGYEKIISDFESGKLDILIGTQMVSKGLDFDRVNLVGILNADTMLNTPDFRAFEKSFQMLAQVSGRAGRKNRQGTVVLQTANPAHPVISYVYRNDWLNFFNEQLLERSQYKYPPFYRLTFIVLKHKNPHTVNQAASRLATMLRSVFGARVSGPQEPPVKRINDYHLQRIIIKVERTASAHKAKALIMENIGQLLSNEQWRYVSIAIDVDPC